MGTLLMIRHGQASFLEQNYDRLSSLGEAQARALGAWWAEQGVRIARVITGPRERQDRSAQLAGEAFAAAGHRWPTVEMLAEFDEMQAESVLKQAIPGLITTHPDVKLLMEAFQDEGDPKESARRFQRVFETVVRMWVRGELRVEDIEPWPHFIARVHQGIQAACRDVPSGGMVAVFTSGGPVAAAMQRALGTADDTTLQLAWMVRNASVSEFLFTGERFTLSTFNTLAHLPDRAQWTFR